MAVNIWSSMPCKELTQLARLGLFSRCRVTGQKVRLTHRVDTMFNRRTSTGLNAADSWCAGSMPCGQLVAAGVATTIPMLPSSSLNFHLSNETSGNVRLARDSTFEARIRQHRGLPGYHLGCRIPSLHAITVRWLHQSQGVLAGHNKWSKVKHIKGPKDALRSVLFNKLILQMRIAIRESGPNPQLNSALASLIAQAKSHAMPKVTIEAVLKSAVRKGSGADADTQLLLEARGPGQTCLLIDILTDNARRTKNEIQVILHKNGGTFGTSLYAFRRKGVVKVNPQGEGQEEALTLDLATEVAIEVGAEDVQETSSEDDVSLFMFICDMGDLRTVRNNLTSRNYRVESSLFEYLPETSVTLSAGNLEDTYRLISILNDNPSVVRIYDNVQSSD